MRSGKASIMNGNVPGSISLPLSLNLSVFSHSTTMCDLCFRAVPISLPPLSISIHFSTPQPCVIFVPALSEHLHKSLFRHSVFRNRLRRSAGSFSGIFRPGGRPFLLRPRGRPFQSASDAAPAVAPPQSRSHRRAFSRAAASASAADAGSRASSAGEGESSSSAGTGSPTPCRSRNACAIRRQFCSAA